MRLNNKVAIVTGAGRGIGRATALLFAKEGAKLVLNDLKAELVQETASLISEQGGESSVVVGDVANAKDVEALAKAAMERYGRIDILDNNAAILLSADFPALAEEEWDRLIDTNVKGIYLCCKSVIPNMIKGGGGSIINVGSILSFVALDGPKNLAPAYVTSKGAVLQLTRALAVRYGRDNIRVNCVCPGFIETDMPEVALAGMSDSPQQKEEIRKAGEAAHPLGRFGKPEEVANAVLFLASDESSFVTGSPLHVDGGYLAR
ncbi:MAG: glucose 1-dehydrogenase [Gammaproteobacteria bacterium]|nr:glucose 1-dehydrogenase [Gammaproteobacteria bacterium]